MASRLPPPEGDEAPLRSTSGVSENIPGPSTRRVASGSLLRRIQHQMKRLWTATSPPPERGEDAAPGALVRRIERETKRTVILATALTDEELFRTCNAQHASPLYSTLPQELRDMVFAYATAEYADPAHMYDSTDYWYRPGHIGRLRTSTTLLRTCRRAWLEAHALPMQQTENAYWFQRGPRDVHADKDWRQNVSDEHQRYSCWISTLSNKALREVRNVRLFTQMFQLGMLASPRELIRFFPVEKLALGFKPRIFQITVRHSDWENWESGAELNLDVNAVKRWLAAPGLGAVVEFKLELETLESKKDQLEVIVQRLLQLEGDAKLAEPTDRDCLIASKFVCKSPPVTNTWNGPTNINNTEVPIFQGLRQASYISKTITWTNTHFPIPERGADKVALYPMLVGAQCTTLPRNYHYLSRDARGLPRPLMTWEHAQRVQSERLAAAPLLEKQNQVAKASAQQVEKYGEQMRRMFEDGMADLEAKRWTERWTTEGSLLRVVDSTT